MPDMPTPPTTFDEAQSILAQRLPGYRKRPQQEALATGIELTFYYNAHLLAEAGTGTGKSLGALIPVILAAAKAEEKKRYIVATSTNALLAQYTGNDLPFLEKELGEAGVKFTWAPLKGISNFLCLAKLKENPAVENLADLLEEIAPDSEGQSEHSGDRNDVQTPLRKGEWPLVSSTSIECPGASKCAMSLQCFGMIHKAAAKDVDVVITNTAIVMTDVKLNKQIRESSPTGLGSHVLLDDYDGLIIDEAHELEETATRFLGFELRQGGLIKYLEQTTSFVNIQGGAEAKAEDQQEKVMTLLEELGRVIVQALDGGKTVLIDAAFITANAQLLLRTYAELERMGSLVSRTKVERGAAEKHQDTKERLIKMGENFLVEFKEILGADPAKIVRWAELYGPAPAVPRKGAIVTAQEHERFERVYAELNVMAAPMPAAREAVQNLGDTYVDGVRELVIASRTPRPDIDAAQIRWLIKTAPIEVGEFLREELWSEVPAVLMSATMGAGTGSGASRFDYIARTLGLEGAATLNVGTPFNYSKQALLYVPPANTPSPGMATRDAWATWVPEATMELIRASGGGAMLLYTSRTSMEAAYRNLAPRLAASGLMSYMQGGDLNNKQIAQRFKDDEDSVLFGLKSFMVGVDFPGRTCRLVVLDKLPFGVPTDPINKAREDAVKAKGGNSFTDLSIPQMTLTLQQAFGRLIRSTTDYGVVAIMDSRLCSSWWGKNIVRALPDAPSRSSFTCVREFFEARESAPAAAEALA